MKSVVAAIGRSSNPAGPVAQTNYRNGDLNASEVFARPTRSEFENCVSRSTLPVNATMRIDLGMVPALMLGAALVSFRVIPAASETGSKVRLNETSVRHARDLIEQGCVLVDLRNAWGEQQPSANAENEFIRQYGFAEYAKWHLGIDDRHAEDTKARYKFPFGDFKNVHRSALLAAKNRARQYGYSEIENAANTLLEMIESKERD